MAMTKEELSKMIGNGWESFRKGDPKSALETFRKVLNDDNDNVDAHYGVGLALRASNDKTNAKSSFETALRIAERELAAIRKGERANDLTTTRDDRYMMLIRMLGQRIAEV